MTHANIPKELQIAIISIHQQCKYTVRHGQRSKTFALEKGVRQGCVLSPLLFTLYSCWIYDQLVAATSACWAEKLMTLYADDSHASFQIESLKDLGIALRAIRILFRLFESTGMKVNATKSCIVLGLRGSAARRWIKRHACFVDGQPALNLGLQAESLALHFLDAGNVPLRNATRQVVNLLQRESPRHKDVTPGAASSATFGVYATGPFAGMCKLTLTHPNVTRLLNCFITRLCPNHRWTTVAVLFNYQLSPHRDHGNAAMPSLVTSLSLHEDGEIWIENPQGTAVCLGWVAVILCSCKQFAFKHIGCYIILVSGPRLIEL